MYRANPKVNVELRQRLPSPGRHHLSPDRPGSSQNLENTDWPQAPQYLQELPTSCSVSPPSHRRSVSPVSPVFQRRSVSSVSPVSPPSYRRSLSPSSSRFPRVPGEMEAELPPSRGPSPRVESSGDDGETSRGPGSPSFRRHLVSAADSPHQISAAGRLQSFDRDKNISFLLKELDALREINNKLQDQLVQKEKELQRREVEEELREEQKEEQQWGRPAAVLEEVLAAQKNRDQALMSRLLLANEERDEALLRARRLQQAESDSFNLEDTDLDIDELIQQVHDADSGQDVQQFGSVLVERLRLARQRRNDITAQEMKAVMEERDRSVIKCKRLEQDLLQEREQRTSEDELLRLGRERDRAVEDRRRLEAEIQTLRANHSSQDLAPPSQPSSRGDGAPPPPQVDPHQAPPPQALLVQLQRMSKEKQSVEAELQRCQEAEREASERVRRLERLVEVLRKKVGAGSLRSVI